MKWIWKLVCFKKTWPLKGETKMPFPIFVKTRNFVFAKNSKFSWKWNYSRERNFCEKSKFPRKPNQIKYFMDSSFLCFKRTGQLGQENWYLQDNLDRIALERTVRAWQPGQDTSDRTTKTGQSGQVGGQVGRQVSRMMSAWTRERGEYGQDTATRPGLQGQDNQGNNW